MIWLYVFYCVWPIYIPSNKLDRVFPYCKPPNLNKWAINIHLQPLEPAEEEMQ